MKERINKELIKLQDQLSTLDKAVSHINKAGKISDEVIMSVKKLHQQYAEQLQLLSRLLETSLKESKTHTENRLNFLSDEHQLMLKKTASLLNNYEKLGDNTFKQYTNYINKSFIHTVENVEKLTKLHELQLQETKNLLNHFQVQTEKTEAERHARFEKANRQHSEKLEITTSKNEKQLTQLSEVHYKQLDAINQMLAKYGGLAEVTSILSDKIKAVDFPEHLQRIDQELSDIQQSTKTRLDVLQKKYEEDTRVEELGDELIQQAKQISTLKTLLLIIVFLMIAGFGSIIWKLFFQ